MGVLGLKFSGCKRQEDKCGERIVNVKEKKAILMGMQL